MSFTGSSSSYRKIVKGKLTQEDEFCISTQTKILDQSFEL